MLLIKMSTNLVDEMGNFILIIFFLWEIYLAICVVVNIFYLFIYFLTLMSLWLKDWFSLLGLCYRGLFKFAFLCKTCVFCFLDNGL